MGEPKIFELNSVKDETEFGDGDDGGKPEGLNFNISVVSNGFILAVSDEDGDLVEVHTDIEEVFKSIRSYV